jgi:hypothetical protein
VVQGGDLVLDGALVERDRLEPVRADRILMTESELRGVASSKSGSSNASTSQKRPSSKLNLST